MAMYSKGMSTRDIEYHLLDIYGVEASPSLISRITDKILPELNEWQSRSLSELYPVVFLMELTSRSKRTARLSISAFTAY